MIKKILILNHNQERFGTYWRCFQIGKRLGEKGHRVTMICASGQSFDLLIRTHKISRNFLIITLPRIKYHQYFTGQILRMVIASFQILFFNYDICYAFAVAQPQIAIPAIIAKKLRRKTLIIDWDDLWGGGFATKHGKLVCKTLTWFEKFTPRYADAITYVSEFLGKKIDKLKIKCQKFKIPNGADTQTIKVIGRNIACAKLELDQTNKYIVSVGNTYVDSLELVMKAFERVHQKINNSYLVFVGQTDFQNIIKTKYRKLLDHVLIVGSRPQKEVPYYLSAADCLLLPMSNDNIDKARFPIRFGDYLCARRPIVASAVGEVKYYLKKYHAGLPSNPTDYKSLSDNIILILSNKKTSKILSENAYRLAQGELNWNNIVKKLMTDVVR
jgi:glycosyltransferase involved in cell wall biosynthesis